MSTRWLLQRRCGSRWPLALAAALLVLALGCAQAPTQPGAPLAGTSPESVGVSSARLDRITATFEQEVAAKRLPGAVVMVSR